MALINAGSVGVGFGVNVRVGSGESVRVGVRVGTAVSVGDGVRVAVGVGVWVGVNNCTGPQAEKKKLDKKRKTIETRKFIFMEILSDDGRARQFIKRAACLWWKGQGG